MWLHYNVHAKLLHDNNQQFSMIIKSLITHTKADQRYILYLCILKHQMCFKATSVIFFKVTYILNGILYKTHSTAKAGKLDIVKHPVDYKAANKAKLTGTCSTSTPVMSY